jgi:hypothetical protein
VLNALIATINKKLVAFEKWDFPDQVAKNEIYGAYIQKFISLTVYMLISYDGLYPLDLFDSLLGTSFQERIDNGQGSSCKYDSVGIALVQLAITEVVVFAISETGKYLVNLVVKKGIQGKRNYLPSRQAALSDIVVWLLYGKAV